MKNSRTNWFLDQKKKRAYWFEANTYLLAEPTRELVKPDKGEQWKVSTKEGLRAAIDGRIQRAPEPAEIRKTNKKVISNCLGEFV